MQYPGNRTLTSLQPIARFTHGRWVLTAEALRVAMSYGTEPHALGAKS